MNRMDFCELLVGSIKEGCNNDKVVTHITNILPKLYEVYNSLNSNASTLMVNKEELELKRTIDISQSIKDICDRKYYYTLTRLEDYLLRYTQSENINLSEIHVVFSILVAILYAEGIDYDSKLYFQIMYGKED